LLQLAQLCKDRGLGGESRVFAYLALVSSPQSPEAHELCGHEKRGDNWYVREGGKKYAFDKLGALRADWGNGWRFESTHYHVLTNLQLGPACKVALELELVYRTFFDWFGHDLGLYEVVEPMVAQIHADKASFPDSDGRGAYFDPTANVLYVDASAELALGALIHEATHQLLYSTAVRTRAGRGEIPGWVDEGLAEYICWSRQGDPGRPRYSKGALAEVHFARHAETDKPYDLSRVLSFLERGLRLLLPRRSEVQPGLHAGALLLARRERCAPHELPRVPARRLLGKPR
jgi:hypothetical protein